MYTVSHKFVIVVGIVKQFSEVFRGNFFQKFNLQIFKAKRLARQNIFQMFHQNIWLKSCHSMNSNSPIFTKLTSTIISPFKLKIFYTEIIVSGKYKKWHINFGIMTKNYFGGNSVKIARICTYDHKKDSLLMIMSAETLSKCSLRIPGKISVMTGFRNKDIFEEFKIRIS